MRFIVDAQLSRKISFFLHEHDHDAIHTLDLPNKNKTSDIEISKISISEKRVVISKDVDFYNRYLTKVEPYKLLYINTGNLSTKALIHLFERNLLQIVEQLEYNSVVEITNDSLITIL